MESLSGIAMTMASAVVIMEATMPEPAERSPCRKCDSVDKVEVTQASYCFGWADRIVNEISGTQVEPTPYEAGKHFHADQVKWQA